MPRQMIYPDTIEQAVKWIFHYLGEDTSYTAHNAIYFDGWRGLAASAVLREIAKHPPLYLREKFNKIIHVDCSRWKSRRALQRTIVQELNLPHRVMDIIDRQDEEDDFRGVDEGSRAEIRDVGLAIHGAMREHICLVVFNNGSENTIDLNDFGIPQRPLDQWSMIGSKVLWTFRGRLRLNSKISENVDVSHVFLYREYSPYGWNFFLQNEAREIAGYNNGKLAEAVEESCLYLLSLNSRGGNIMDYNWASHASNYWVCDGIIEGGQFDEAWENAAALHRQIHVEDYSSNALPSFGNELETPPKRWILATDISALHPESTSFFLASVRSISDPPLRPLPSDMFHQSEKLRVLKLCGCTFSFSSPPFCCCHRLRFLGLDGCKDKQEEDEKQDRDAMLIFQSLWVLDICNTDWDLASSPEIIDQMATNIREVHINKGRIWSSGLAWRQLQNLRKIRVIEPTLPWETGQKDEFINMVKMEFLDLSGNNTIQVLPSLSGASSLKTMVLDGCVGLEHVEGLPLSLESFSFDAGPPVKNNYREANIRCISMAGCAKLSYFKLHGSFPNLEEVDLSGTKVKTLDLRAEVVWVPCLQRVILLGCDHLHAVLWPEEGMPQLSFLCIDTRGGEELKIIPPDLDKLKQGHGQAYFAMMDMKFIRLLVPTSYKFFWHKDFSLTLCISSSGQWCNKEKMGPESSGKICRSPSLILKHSYSTYTDVAIDDIAIEHDYNCAPQFQPLRYHVEIGDGISNTSMESAEGIEAIMSVMDKALSLHVHDNSSITTVIPADMLFTQRLDLTWYHLKQCHVVRCPKMQSVFIHDSVICFGELENFWAADLLMAHCIWSQGRRFSYRTNYYSFVNLRSIHLYSCPRLAFVLTLWCRASDYTYFPNLETLHIVNCGNLFKVFPLDPELLATTDTDYWKRVMWFPKLKHIYLHELPKLHHICEADMFAPKLETVRIRGCWSLKRLPAVSSRYNRRPIVDCEKEWWEKLVWDGLEAFFSHDPSLFGLEVSHDPFLFGLEASHDPSLFEPRHSSYYKKPLPRVSVLR